MCEIDEMRASLGVRGPTPDGGYETAATLPADTRITVPGGCYSPRCNLWSTATGAECRTCGVKFASIAEAAMHRENTRLAAEVSLDNSLLAVWQKRSRAAEARVRELESRVAELEGAIRDTLDLCGRHGDPSDRKLFRCEICDAEHEDYTLVPHAENCNYRVLRRVLEGARNE